MSLPDVGTKVGEDYELAWNDRHLQHVYLWLTLNPNSPYKNAPAMLLHAMGVPVERRSDFRRDLKRGDLSNFRFSVRCRLTKSFKRVLAGEYDATITKRNKNGIVIGYEVKAAVNPTPLPCPPFYRGSIRITTKGMRIMLRAHEAVMGVKHDPEGRLRLLNPFLRSE
jgi:hypothetical protein